MFPLFSLFCMTRQESHFEKNFNQRDEISIDELLKQIFSNIKRSYILPKNAKRVRKMNMQWSKKGDVDSFIEGPCALPFEHPSATVCFMLGTTSECWSRKYSMV